MRICQHSLIRCPFCRRILSFAWSLPSWEWSGSPLWIRSRRKSCCLRLLNTLLSTSSRCACASRRPERAFWEAWLATKWMMKATRRMQRIGWLKTSYFYFWSLFSIDFYLPCFSSFWQLSILLFWSFFPTRRRAKYYSLFCV